MTSKKVKYISIAGLFTAVVFVLTAYLHIPVATGYVHVGDAFIYLAASILPMPFGILVGAGGALLADALTGYAIWAPASIVIKAVSAMMFTSKSSNIICKRNIMATFPCAIFCVGGYYLYEGIITLNFAAPLAGVLGNVVQSLSSAVIYILVGFALDRIKVKDLLK